MKVLVAVKRVVDYQVKVRVKDDGSGVETQNVKMAMNPFDEIALEQAIRLKESGVATEVVAVSIGSDACQETLRYALALGADRAILVKTDEVFEPINIAKILEKLVLEEEAPLVLLGKQAIDDDCNQTGQMLAGRLNYAQATFASHVAVENKKMLVTREVDRGLQTIAVNLPAVITADLRLNEPRFASLPNIMKSKTKPLKEIELSTLALSLAAHTEVVKVEKPQQRQAGVKVNSISEVLAILKEKGAVQ